MKVQNKDGKGNPYHSDSNGQFTSANGGGGASNSFADFDWGDTDAVLMPHLENIIDDLTKKFPTQMSEIGMKLKYHDDDLPHSAVAGVVFNPFKRNRETKKYETTFSLSLSWVFYNKERVLEEINYLYEKRHSPMALLSDNEKIQAIITHEYGHIIAKMFMLKTNPDLLNRIKSMQQEPSSVFSWEVAEDLIKQNKECPLETSILNELGKEYGLDGSDLNDRIANEYGTYASGLPDRLYDNFDEREFFAEALACMIHLEDDKKTDFMRSFEDIFKRKYGEVFGG